MTTQEIKEIVERHSGERGDLISILEDIQSKYSYLPEDALRTVAEKTGRGLTDIYGLATFYKWFSLKPRGKHLCSVCLGTACHVRGGAVIAEEFGRKLGIKAGETTSDKEFTLETVNCLGACALGPIVVVDGHYFSNVKPVEVKDILSKAQSGLDKVDIKTDQRVFPIETACSRCNHSLMDSDHRLDGAPPIRVSIAFAQTHGWLLLSSVYGSYNLRSEHEIPVDTAVNFFCPHCHAELTGYSKCIDCGASMVPMIIRGGGILQICSRRGCKAHRLDLDGVNL